MLHLQAKSLYSMGMAVMEAGSMCALRLQMLPSEIRMNNMLSRYLTLHPYQVVYQNCSVFSQLKFESNVSESSPLEATL